MHMYGDALEACKISIHTGTSNSVERVTADTKEGVVLPCLGGLNMSVPYALQSRARYFDSEPG